MQRTLKRELKVLEIVKREAIGSSEWRSSFHLGEGPWFAGSESHPIQWWPPACFLGHPSSRALGGHAESTCIGGGGEGRGERYQGSQNTGL